DQKYNNETVSKLINYIMLDGKKTVARKQVYQAMEELEVKTKTPAAEALAKAFANVSPKVEVRSRRVGGANYQVPMPVSGRRQEALAMRWIINAARSSKGSKDFWQSLANELISAFNNEGNAIRKKEE